MRLGQLARQLSIKPSEVKDYLTSKGVPFEGTSNHKIPDEFVEEIIAHFSPQTIEEELPIDENSEEIKEEIIDSEPEVEHNDSPTTEAVPDELGIKDQNQIVEVDEVAEVVTLEAPVENLEKSLETVEASTPIEITTEVEIKEKVLTVQEILEKEEAIEEGEEENEKEPDEVGEKILIKAPKVSLPGLKVVGKIDLPEPVQKPEKVEDEVDRKEEDNEKEIKRSRKSGSYQRRDGRRQNRNKRRPLTLEEKREREKRSEERKKKSLQKKKKKEKKQHYLDQVKNAPAIKPKKSKKEKLQATKEPKAPPPKTIVGKFWRWLNT